MFENFRCFEITKISSKYCRFLFLILFFCRLNLEIAVSNRTMTQIFEKTNDFAKKMKKRTIRNC